MPNDPLKLASEALSKAIETEKRNRKLLDSIGPAIIQALRPTLERIESAVSRIKVDVQPRVEVNPEVRIPDINIPEIIVPEIRVPTPIVNYTPPAINVPRIEMPDEMNIKGWVSLMGVDLEHPLPVQLRNADGSPFNPFENMTTILNAGGGGSRHVKVDNTVAITTGESLLVQQLSGAIDSVVVNDVLVTVGVNQVSGANWSVSVADTMIVNQLSGSIWSIADGGGSLTVDATDLDIRALDVGQDEVLVHQVSGANWSVNVPGTVTVSATDLDIRDLVDTSDSIRSYQLSGAIWSTQGNLVARQTNPTAASDGSAVLATADDLGRTLTRPVQVRDLIATAYVSVTNGTETTLLAASAGVFHDLIMLVGSNNSDAAVSVDIRAVTAGSIINTLRIPANGTAGFVPTVPWPQDATGNNWTVDGPDETGRTLTFSALFSKEV